MAAAPTERTSPARRRLPEPPPGRSRASAWAGSPQDPLQAPAWHPLAALGEHTRRDLRASVARLGSCTGIIDFDCVQRTLELRHQARTEEYAALFSAIPTVGFSTYGESYIGHVNQTATLLLLS
jgi:hypothetical protein